MTTPTDPMDPPPGFVDMFENEPFESMIGPILYCDAAGKRVGGFRAEAKHVNIRDIVHGGMLIAFADSALTGIYFYPRDDSSDDGIVTVTLNCEFVGPAHIGDWIECHGEVVRRGKSMVYLQGRLTVGDRVIMTCSTVLKRMSRASRDT